MKSSVRKSEILSVPKYFSFSPCLWRALFIKKKNSGFFWCGPFLKSLLTFFYHIASVLSLVFCGILASSLIGIKPAPPNLDSKVLTSWLPAVSLWIASWRKQSKEIKGGKKELKEKTQAWQWNKEEGWGERSTPWEPIPSLTHLPATRTAPQKGDARISIPLTKRVLNYSMFLRLVLFQKAPSCSSLPFFPSYFVLILNLA